MEYISFWNTVKLFAAVVWSIGWVQMLAYLIVFIIAFFIGYCAVMSMQRAKDAEQLTTAAKVLAYPIAAVFIVADAFANFTVFVLIFIFEWPKIVTWSIANKYIRINNDFLVTQRLERYLYHTEAPKKPETPNQWFKSIFYLYCLDSWRMAAAKWLAANYIDPFAPNGQHCKNRKSTVLWEYSWK